MNRALKAAVLLAALTLLPGAASSRSLAAKNGSGQGAAYPATLAATPNPVLAWGGEFWISGCGFELGQQVNIVINEPRSIPFFPVAVDSQGCLVPAKFWTDDPGTYSITASQILHGRKQTVMAVTTLTVQ